MSDILIRGMEMPKTCAECQIKIAIHCDGWNYVRSAKLDRYKKCPLHELSEHGDLIDRDWLKRMAYSKVEDFGGAFLDTIDIAIAPVMIPSNKENKNANQN